MLERVSPIITVEKDSQVDLDDIAFHHRFCLPHTPAARAGLKAIRSLYQATLEDKNCVLIWAPQGAFISGTVNLRKTEKRIRSSIELSTFLKLVFNSVISPGHLFARRTWESLIPTSGVGYILTLGNSAALRKEKREVSTIDLLIKLENFFIERGLSEIWVDTEASNDLALRFYLRHDFEKVSEVFGHVLLKKSLFLT